MRNFSFLSLFLCSFCANTNAQQAQKVAFTNVKFLNEISPEGAKYAFKVQQLPNQTYGYVIYANDQLYLKQLNAPGKDVNIGFSSEESAKKAAKIIIYKLEHPTVPPTLNTLEMKYLNID